MSRLGYLEVREGRKNGTIIALPIVRESAGVITTKELFSFGVRDLCCSSMRKGEVRWNKDTKRRVGDNGHPDNPVSLSYVGVVKEVPVPAPANYYVVD